MRFVPTKTVEQQSCLMRHRARHLLIRQQTAVINSIRAYLAEFGVRDCRTCWARLWRSRNSKCVRHLCLTHLELKHSRLRRVGYWASGLRNMRGML